MARKARLLLTRTELGAIASGLKLYEEFILAQDWRASEKALALADQHAVMLEVVAALMRLGWKPAESESTPR